MNKTLLAFCLLFATTSTITLAARTIDIVISQESWELRPGLKTTVWAYNKTVPGPSIFVQPNEQLVINIANKLPVTTNIHWHGVKVPNDQDGPGIAIAPGKSFSYHFAAPESGTFWYHSHEAPVLTQMDMGLYGAFIVNAKEDALYSSDRTFVLDDWYLDSQGRRRGGTARDGMERLGNIETVNGKTGIAIQPLLVKSGELHKLRLRRAQ